MQYFAVGATWVEGQLRLDPVRWMGMGLMIAVLTGAGAIVLGFPFLTSHTAHVSLPILGEMHIPTAVLFDAGIFAVVMGSTLLMLIALAHQSIRSHRRRAG